MRLDRLYFPKLFWFCDMFVAALALEHAGEAGNYHFIILSRVRFLGGAVGK
jgi:hypothetical protein